MSVLGKIFIIVLIYAVGRFFIGRLLKFFIIQKKQKWLGRLIFLGLCSITSLAFGGVALLGAIGIFTAPTVFGKLIAVVFLVVFGWIGLFTGGFLYLACREIQMDDKSRPYSFMDNIVLFLVMTLGKCIPQNPLPNEKKDRAIQETIGPDDPTAGK